MIVVIFLRNSGKLTYKVMIGEQLLHSSHDFILESCFSYFGFEIS